MYPPVISESAAMDMIPPEIVGHIAGYLDTRSLHNFALVSRRSANATDQYRFHTLKKTTLQDVEYLLDIMTEDRLRYVQRLEISHDFYSEPQPAQVQDAIRLLGLLPALRDVSWISRQPQIPLDLLRRIETLKPRCRLHIPTFDLRSLTMPPSTGISAEDLAVATSPCLHSIYNFPFPGPHFSVSPLWKDHMLFDLVMEMIAGGAENLKEVMMQLEEPIEQPRKQTSWLGQTHTKLRSGRLEILGMNFWSGGEAILKQSVKTDFSCLRKLDLVFPETDSSITWFKSGAQFPNLVELNIACWDPSHKDCVVALCRSLPRLKKLRVQGNDSIETLRQIVEGCVQLQLLQVCSYIDTQFLIALQACKELEDLDIMWQRDAGTPGEAAFLQALGALPKLGKIRLEIASAHTTYRGGQTPQIIGLTDPDLFSEPDLNEIYYTLRDLAIDGRLARSMFRYISAIRPQYSPLLETLEIQVIPYQEPFVSVLDNSIRGLEDMLSRFTSHWSCVRAVYDDKHHHCHAVPKHQSAYMEDHVERLAVDRFDRVLRELWPSREDRGPWEAWRSIPIFGTG